jgi:hypothetical protein
VQGNNRIGDRGVKALGEALQVNNTVQKLGFVSVFFFFCCAGFALVLLLRGVRVADVCGAVEKPYR